MASSIAAAARADALQASFDRKLSHYRHEILRIEATDYSLTDRGRAAASSRHSNASVRGRHRLQSKRAAFVGEILSSQVETRNPNRSPAAERGPAESFRASRVALRWHY